jgi:hypothetical protein
MPAAVGWFGAGCSTTIMGSSINCCRGGVAASGLARRLHGVGIGRSGRRWSGIGYGIIVLLGGLQTIDKSIYEAASLDGCGPVRMFFKVTVPLLTPSCSFSR